jgi:RF-1 domain
MRINHRFHHPLRADSSRLVIVHYIVVVMVLQHFHRHPCCCSGPLRVVQAWTTTSPSVTELPTAYSGRFMSMERRIFPYMLQQPAVLRSRRWSHPVHPALTSRQQLRFLATNEIDMNNYNSDDDDDMTDDDDYMDTDRQWMVPSSIFIPQDQLRISFVRSSGAGGQNVNKVSSCVQVQFHVLSAEWMGPLEVRQRFQQTYKNQVSNHGLYRIESQEHRSQVDNRKDVLKKLEQAVLAVWPRPKVRRVRVGLSEKGKRNRKNEKLKQSSKKESRRNQRFDF